MSSRASISTTFAGVFQQDPTEFTSRRQRPQDGIRQLDITNYGLPGPSNSTPESRRRDVQHLHLQACLGFSPLRYHRLFRPPNLNVELGQSAGRDRRWLGAKRRSSRVPLVELSGSIESEAAVSGSERPPVRGVVYRHGPTFDFDTMDGPDTRTGNQFRIPDTYAMGGALEIPRPGRRLLLLGKVTRSPIRGCAKTS
jgi:hypothetical protein